MTKEDDVYDITSAPKGAVALPYIAVVVANAGRETVIPGASILKKRPRGIE